MEKAAAELVRLCYRYACLRERQHGGPLNSDERGDWKSLVGRLEGDPDRQRRGHRRHSISMPAEIKTADAWQPATLRDISGAGMYIETDEPPPMGATVRVRVVGESESGSYVFSCLVERVAHQGCESGMGVSFSGSPVRLLQGSARLRH